MVTSVAKKPTKKSYYGRMRLLWYNLAEIITLVIKQLYRASLKWSVLSYHKDE